MSKRLFGKLMVMLVAVGAMSLLQGCGEDDNLAYSFMWRSAGVAPAPGTSPVMIQVSSAGFTW